MEVAVPWHVDLLGVLVPRPPGERTGKGHKINAGPFSSKMPWMAKISSLSPLERRHLKREVRNLEPFQVLGVRLAWITVTKLIIEVLFIIG